MSTKADSFSSDVSEEEIKSISFISEANVINFKNPSGPTERCILIGFLKDRKITDLHSHMVDGTLCFRTICKGHKYYEFVKKRLELENTWKKNYSLF